MNMLNLIFVKYFCDAVQLGSISAASKVNFITQSAISQGIAKLEQSLGIPLLAHHPNRFRITPEGENLLEHFMKLLRQSEEIHHMICDGKIDYMGDLIFSSTQSFAYAVLPAQLKKFYEKYSHVRINLSLDFPDMVQDKVKNGKVDFGILPDNANLDKFKKNILYTGKYQIYSSGDNHATSSDPLFIATEMTSMETSHLKDIYYKKFKKEIAKFIEVDSWEMIAKLISQGLGIGYLPDYFTKNRTDLSLREYELGLEAKDYRIVAISPKGMKLRKSSEIFLSSLRSCLQEN